MVNVGKHSDVVRSLAEPRLEPGESVIETVLVNYNGSVPAASLPGGSRADDPDAEVTFPSARQMAIGLTDRRLLVFSLSFGGKPKQHVGDVPLSAVDEVSMTDNRLSGIMRLTLRSGARVDLEVLPREPGDAFLRRLSARVTPAPAASSGPDLPSWDAPLAGDDLRREGSGTGADEPPLPPPVPLPPLSQLQDLTSSGSSDLPPPPPDLPPPPDDLLPPPSR